MIDIVTIKLATDRPSFSAMSASTGSLLALLARDLEGCEHHAQFFGELLEGRDIFRCEVDFDTAGTGICRLIPTDRYLGLNSAIVADGYACAGILDHEWPLLSCSVASNAGTIATPCAASPGKSGGPA